jgi:hypothetical protein
MPPWGYAQVFPQAAVQCRSGWLRTTPLANRAAEVWTRVKFGTSPLVRESLVAPWSVTCVGEKIFWRDYPRGFVNRFCFWWFAVLDTLSGALALPPAFLLAGHRFPISHFFPLGLLLQVITECKTRVASGLLVVLETQHSHRLWRRLTRPPASRHGLRTV